MQIRRADTNHAAGATDQRERERERETERGKERKKERDGMREKVDHRDYPHLRTYYLFARVLSDYISVDAESGRPAIRIGVKMSRLDKAVSLHSIRLVYF